MYIKLSLNVPAIFFSEFWRIVARNVSPLEELHSNDGKDEFNKHGDEQDVADALQSRNDALNNILKREERFKDYTWFVLVG